MFGEMGILMAEPWRARDRRRLFRRYLREFREDPYAAENLLEEYSFRPGNFLRAAWRLYSLLDDETYSRYRAAHDALMLHARAESRRARNGMPKAEKAAV